MNIEYLSKDLVKFKDDENREFIFDSKGINLIDLNTNDRVRFYSDIIYVNEPK